MDAFYAAVEMRDDPSLRAVPMAVGGVGMISTANYAARRFGVRSAMPGFIGVELCKMFGAELRFVRPNFAKYQEASRRVRAVLARYDAGARMLSLDEAALDLTDAVLARCRPRGDRAAAGGVSD